MPSVEERLPSDCPMGKPVGAFSLLVVNIGEKLTTGGAVPE